MTESLHTKKRLLELLEERENRHKFNQLQVFEPYDWQKKLANSSREAAQMLAMCFGGETEVWMADGSVKPIRSVKKGDSVLAWDREINACVPSMVVETHSRIAHNACLASWGRSNNNTFVVTDNHEMLTKKNKLKPIGEYGSSDTTKIPNSALISSNESVSKELAWLVGAWLGDGHYKKPSGTINITNIDSEVIAKIRENCAALGMKVRDPKQPGDYSYWLAGAGKGKNPLINELRKQGILGLSRDQKCLPESYLGLPEDVLREVVDGLFCTDGHSAKGSLRFYNTSKKLVSQLRLCLLRLGVVSSVQRRSHDNPNHKDCYRLVVTGDEYLKKIGDITGKPVRLKDVATSPAQSRKVRLGDLRFTERVFCITVDHPDHLFIAAGFIVKNCANQVGKTRAGSYITACHLTGLYPDWWRGKKFNKPINAWACGVSNETTRDILQFNLLGEPTNPEALGTGFIPKDCIKSTTRKPQVPNAVQSILVSHHSPMTGNINGVSRLDFKAYEQGETKFMGRPMDWIWLDEQPEDSIYTQCITRTVATDGMVLMTFTPEDGINKTIHQFMTEPKPGQFLVQATWDDAPHLSEERKEQLLAQYSPRERILRSRGVPVFGDGMVFPVDDDDIRCEPFDIPDYWPRIAGIDFGWDHPTAVVWLAWDRETSKVYLYNEYRAKERTPQEHSPAIRAGGQWIPVVWPHDGIQHDKGSGIGLADQYRKEGVKMTMDHFRNPLTPGESGKGNIRVEPGITAILQSMQNGNFKVFSHCVDWFEEKGTYHREDGKIVPIMDDLMSATRYAFQSLARHAKTRAETNEFRKYDGVALPVQSLGIV